MSEVHDEIDLDAAEADALRAFEAEAGEVFPQLGAAQAGDEALIAGLADRAIAGVGAAAAAGTGAVVGVKTIMIAAAVVAVGLVAVLASRGDPPAEPVAVASGPVVEENTPIAREPERESAIASTVAPAVPEDEPAIEPERKPERERARAPEPAPKPDVAALLREGNAARRAGDNVRAREIYRRIRKEFPGSREDMLVRVSLGQLALDHFDDPKDAVGQFGTYLRDNPKGTLAEEAALGRIAALRKLGRKDAERAMLQDFLGRFPDSIHEDAIAKRLAELDR